MKKLLMLLAIFVLFLGVVGCEDTTPKTYTLRFDTLGGERIDAVDVNLNETYNLPTAVREGFVFQGWYDSLAFQNEITVTTPINQSYILYARWVEKEITYYFDSVGGDDIAPIHSLRGRVITDPIPYRLGHEFKGWYEDLEYVVLHNFSEVPDEDITLYAKWEVMYYILSFDTALGSTIDAQFIAFGSELTPPEPPLKEDATFIGWFLDPAKTIPFVFELMPAEDFTIYAKWEYIEEPTYEGYYEALNFLEGQALRNQLSVLITSTMRNISYDSARQILQISDRDPNNFQNVLLVYDRQSVLSTWDAGATWNREHVWPQSKLNGASASDIHNIRACDPWLNNSRGNLPFVSGSGNARIVSGGFWPGDDDKGDVARILLYMNIRWGLAITEGYIGDLELMLQWHIDDPVDDFERNRNDVLYSYQQNRNPFIDHPELAFEVFSETLVSFELTDDMMNDVYIFDIEYIPIAYIQKKEELGFIRL